MSSFVFYSPTACENTSTKNMYKTLFKDYEFLKDKEEPTQTFLSKNITQLDTQKQETEQKNKDCIGGYHSVGAEEMINAHPFFSMCICGPSLSGKTTLALHILEQFVKHNRYETYIIMSPTAKATEVFKPYLKNPKNIVDTYDEEFLQGLLDKQAQTPKTKRKKMCLILDDTVGSAGKMQKSKVFADLWALARNMNITVILLSQAVSRHYLPKIARCNCHYLACCGLRGKSCLDTLKTDYLDGYGNGKEGLELYKSITTGKYKFCLFCLRDKCGEQLSDWVKQISVPEKVPPFTMNNDYMASAAFTFNTKPQDKKKFNGIIHTKPSDVSEPVLKRKRFKK